MENILKRMEFFDAIPCDINIISFTPEQRV